jgi:uncharacterized RDD family membrane protein YckC
MRQPAFTGPLRLGDSVPTPRPAAPAQAAAPQPGSRGPQFAVRGRLNAIVLDLVLLTLVTSVLVAALGEKPRSADGLLLLLALQLGYFFICETRGGQTIGKRVFHVRVATLSGAPLTMRQVAVRTIFRLFDGLPMLYASGLISLMRTGRERRQRIGDVVAGTTVVLDSAGKPLRTPRWLLPAATLLAVLASVALLAPTLAGGHRARAPLGQASPQFTPEEPVNGPWLATGTTASSIGYSNMPIGERFTSTWQITQECVAGRRCSRTITLALPHESPVRAELRPSGEGWYALLPTLLRACRYSASGRPIYWRQRSLVLLRFTDAGRRAEAYERDRSAAPACGYGADTVTWRANLR